MLQELVDYCDSSITLEDPNLKCYGKSSMACDKCLKDIHFKRVSNCIYDCINMCHWYVCQDIYKYATEMAWLLHDNKLDLHSRELPLSICSIGCGPCSELIAIDEYITRNKLPFEYSYTGFDQNEIWATIQQKVISLSTYPEKIKIFNEDVFDFYSKTEERPNIIILNYMLSDMLNNRKDEFSSFIDSFCEFVASIPSCTILINDINLGRNDNEPRYYYNIIYRNLVSKCGLSDIYQKTFHFENTKKFYFKYGDKRDSNALLFHVPNSILNKYNTNTECHSAQMILIKAKDITK